MQHFRGGGTTASDHNLAAVAAYECDTCREWLLQSFVALEDVIFRVERAYAEKHQGDGAARLP